MNKKIIIVITVLFLLLIIPAASQASGSGSYGTSSITLNHSSGTAGRGGSASTGYTVKLVSGTKWGTTISAVAPSGISVAFSNSCADPSYSGTMTVTAGKTVSPGIYNISIKATGDDPSTSTVTYTLNVTNSTVAVPPPKVIPNNLPFEIGGIIIAVSLILAVIPAVLPALVQAVDKNRIHALLVVSAAALIPSLYLAVDDPVLRTSAPLHYGLLILYIILLITALVMVFKSRTRNYSMGLFRILGGGMFALMLVDTVFGLPVSSTYAAIPYMGWKYLFGFGTTSISSTALSVAFSVIMMASALLFSFSIKNTKISKKHTVKTVNNK